MKNAEWCIKNGLKFTNIYIQRRSKGTYDILYFGDWDEDVNQTLCLDCGFVSLEDSRNLSNIIIEWLDTEHEEGDAILTDKERLALKGELGLLTNSNVTIHKEIRKTSTGDRVYIVYSLRSPASGEWLYRQSFISNGSVFKGMIVNVEYTPAQLGLDE